MMEEERDRQSASVGVENDDGESVSPEMSEEPQEENKGAEINERHFPKKKVAIISACLAAVVVIGLIVAFVAVPSYEYGRGMECLGQGNYQEAKDCFSKSNRDDAGDYISYCDAMIALADGDYETALASLDGLDVEDSVECRKEAFYGRGRALFESGSLSDARSAFLQAGDYQDASSKAELCQNALNLLDAEKEYDQGHLGKAQDKFESLPEDFEYKDISVASRLKTLSDNQQIVDLCGTWINSGTATGSTKQYWSAGDNRWEGWDLDMTGQYKLEISCIINDDGTIRYKGSAEFEYPTNYSSLSSLVKTSKDKVSFDVTFDGLPDTLYEKDSAELAYQGGSFALSYNKYDDAYSAHFTYEYSCNVVYDTKTVSN